MRTQVLGWCGLFLVLAMGTTFSSSPDLALKEALMWRPPTGGERGVLLVLDGQNEAATRFFQDVEWRQFCRTQQLTLVGLQLVSPDAELKAMRGYYDSSLGAGKEVWEYLASEKISTERVFLFGFSGGAIFTASFVLQNPERVTGWCSYAASKWPRLTGKIPALAPGVVACGEGDTARLGPSLAFFQAWRQQGHPLAWLTVPETGHRRNLGVEAFARDFFTGLLRQRGATESLIYDNQQKTVCENQDLPLRCTSALPDAAVVSSWLRWHQP